MNWGTAEKIFQRKPYLLDPYRCRSVKDAKKLLAKEGMPSAEQVLTAARLRAGMSMSEWEAYTGMSTKTMERKCKRVTPVRFGGLFTLPRRVVVALVIVIILTTFMACTPLGRSLAVRAYNAIVEVIDGILYVRSEEADNTTLVEQTIIDTNDSVIQLDSLDAMLSYVERPVFFLPDDSFELISAQFTSSPLFGDQLECTYISSNGIDIVIKQEWKDSNESRITVDGTDALVTIGLTNGCTIEGVYSLTDGTFVGSIVGDDILAHILIYDVDAYESIEQAAFSLIIG